jgi:hypothetical protein
MKRWKQDRDKTLCCSCGEAWSAYDDLSECDASWIIVVDNGFYDANRMAIL